jgi:hypothetical protein
MSYAVVVIVIKAAVDLAYRDDRYVDGAVRQVIVSRVMGRVPDRFVERRRPRHSKRVIGTGTATKEGSPLTGDLRQRFERAEPFPITGIKDCLDRLEPVVVEMRRVDVTVEPRRLQYP